MNVAGCIANEQGDTSSTGCGAALQALGQCEQDACSGCYNGAGTSFNDFSNCEKSARSTLCQAYGNDEGRACGGIHDAGSPASTCFPAANAVDTAKAAYDAIAPLFCGK